MNKKYQHYYDQMKDSKIEVLCAEEKIKAYYLRKYPDRRMMSTLIIFSPEGIVITGDLRPVRTGCMTYGYNLEWFVGELSPQYLAEKFLEIQWSEEYAKDFIKTCIEEMKENEELEKAKEVEDLSSAYCFESSHEFYNTFSGVIDDLSGTGMDYLEQEVGWLSAIQKKFAEEWHKI